MNNYNENNKSLKNQHKSTGIKMALMMMLCCLIPIAIYAGLPLFGISGGFAYNLIFLLCPIMHIGMMFTMRKSGRKSSCHSNTKSKT